MGSEDKTCHREDVLRELTQGVAEVRGGVMATQKTVDSLYVLTTERDQRQNEDVRELKHDVKALTGMQRWLIGALMGAGILVGGGGVGVGVAVAPKAIDHDQAVMDGADDDEAYAEAADNDDGDT